MREINPSNIIYIFYSFTAISLLVGKARKADLELNLNKKGLLAFYSQLGKNDITAVKVIGANPQEFHDAYYEKENTRVKTMRGIVSLIKVDNPKKEINEKIEAFIKSNTTKKEDDEKMTIKELSEMFSEIAKKIHKENNSSVVDFLPTNNDIVVTNNDIAVNE